MKLWSITGGAMVVVMAMAPASRLYGGVSSASQASAGLTSTSQISTALPGGVAILREIDDPATGNRWLLEPAPEHPGGPGRLILAAAGNATGRKMNNGAPMEDDPALAMPVIRAGDAVTLVAHTDLMDAQLEAVALAPASAGARFAARLKIGGSIVEAVALGPRRAQWLPSGGETR